MQKLDLHGIITETERRGLSFNQLLTIPERDDWEYSDGKSTTCVAFILSMYKAAGVFAPFTESIQVTEFTVSSASSGPSSLQQRNDLLLELLESVSYCIHYCFDHSSGCCVLLPVLDPAAARRRSGTRTC